MPDRTLIVCKSVHHQNTAKVARIIANVLDAEVCAPEEVLPAAIHNYDLVGFGSGIHFGRFHVALRQWINQLPDAVASRRRAFVFSTAGLPFLNRLWHRSLKQRLSNRGFDVVAEFCRHGFDTVGPLWLVGGLNRGHPDAVDLGNASTFARQLLAESLDAGLAHPMCSSP